MNKVMRKKIEMLHELSKYTVYSRDEDYEWSLGACKKAIESNECIVDAAVYLRRIHSPIAERDE